MTRLSRFDYDILTQAHIDGYYPAKQCDKPGQLSRLLNSGTVTSVQGSLVLTDFGKRELYRVRRVGKDAALPVGFFAAPKRPSDAFLERYGFQRHAYRAFVKALTK